MSEALINNPIVSSLLHGLNTITNVAGASLSTLGKGIGLDEATSTDGLNPVGLGIVTEDEARSQAYGSLMDAGWNQGVETEQIGVFFKKPTVVLLLMPIIIAVVVVTVVTAIRTVVVVNVGKSKKDIFPGLFPPEKEEYYPPEYYPEYPEDVKPEAPSKNIYKRSIVNRRDVTKVNTTSSAIPTLSLDQVSRFNTTSSATPTLSFDQVNRLTSVITSALQAEECLHRLLCETGTWSKEYPTLHATVKFVKVFLPQHLLAPFEIFYSGENCERFTCGQLPLKK